MDSLTVQPLKTTFETQPVVLHLNTLESSRQLPRTATSGKKFLQILASIATVGLVEPLIVARISSSAEVFRILDGRLRIEALRRLGLEKAQCIIATDDEAYTYNRYISRLTSAQDARMIAKAIGQGVSRERIAQVLGIDVNTVKRRASLLEGISPEAAALLGDKMCPATTFRALKLLKPLRQIAAVELMCGQGNFTSSFARAIVAATPPEQLEPGSDRRVRSEVAEQLATLERELSMLQTAVAQTDERYGIEHLHLTVSAAYVAKLMGNGCLRQWLDEHHPDYSTQLDTISSDAQSARSRPSTREPRSKNFRRVEAKTAGR